MLEIIEAEKEIRRAQTLFMTKIGKMVDIRDTIFVGYQGESQKHEASWSHDLGIWWISEESGNRYWNAFGTVEPKWKTRYSHSITCEINPPFRGVNRTIAGAFAEDSYGKIYLLHRGKIGGGRKGIGKTRFWMEYRGDWQEAKDGEVFNRLALIGSLESPRFACQVASFVKEVERIKTVSVSSKLPEAEHFALQATFKKEFHGTQKVSSKIEEVERRCDHGLVVNALAENIDSKGIAIGNNPLIDLYAIDEENNPRILFEIKTDTTKTQIYEAIGQLFFNSAKMDRSCHLIAVFPRDIDEEAKDVIVKLGIRCLTYEWIDNKPYFHMDFNPKSLM